MGMYMYITDYDIINMRKVNDLEIKEIFNEALQHDPTLMITEHFFYKKDNWFKKRKKVPFFNIYHEYLDINGMPAYEARQQVSACGEKRVVIAYLYGIINGSQSHKKSCSV